jgi:hypothetical protein
MAGLPAHAACRQSPSQVGAAGLPASAVNNRCGEASPSARTENNAFDVATATCDGSPFGAWTLPSPSAGTLAVRPPAK